MMIWPGRAKRLEETGREGKKRLSAGDSLTPEAPSLAARRSQVSQPGLSARQAPGELL